MIRDNSDDEKSELYRQMHLLLRNINNKREGATHSVEAVKRELLKEMFPGQKCSIKDVGDAVEALNLILLSIHTNLSGNKKEKIKFQTFDDNATQPSS